MTAGPVDQFRGVDALCDGDRRERGADDGGGQHEAGGGRVEVGHGVERVRAPGHTQRRVGRQPDDERRRQQDTTGCRRDADDSHYARPRQTTHHAGRLQAIRAAVAHERQEVRQTDDTGSRVHSTMTAAPPGVRAIHFANHFLSPHLNS